MNTFIQGKEQHSEMKPLSLESFYCSGDVFQHQGQLCCRQPPPMDLLLLETETTRAAVPQSLDSFIHNGEMVG